MRRLCAVFVALAALAATPAASLGLIRDAEIEALLADYTNPLLEAAGLDPQVVGLRIVDDPALNAFVAGGRNIYLHTGLILEAEQPNMVVGVIAHEIGHITGGHLARTSQAIGGLQRPALVATILGLGSLLAGAPDLGMAVLTGSQHVLQRSFFTYSRAQEASADVIALELLEATGQSPDGLIVLMDDMADQEILSETHQDPYARSHPMSRDRANAYVKGAEKSAYRHVEDTPERQFRHAMVRAKIHGFKDDPATTLRRYPDDTPPAQYARAIAYHRRGETARSVGLIDGLLERYPDNPWLYELKGQVLYESGRAAEARTPYLQAVSMRPNTALLLIGLATCRLGIGTEEAATRALRDLQAARRLEPDDTTTYFQLAKAYGQLNDIGRAEGALAEFYALQGGGEAQSNATRHALRALEKLPAGSPEHIRAGDIVALSAGSDVRTR